MKSYLIAVMYDGRYVIAKATQLESIITAEFFVEFPNGYKNTFYAIDDKDESWGEQTLAVTELSKEVGNALEVILAGKYAEPAMITVDDRVLIIVPVDHKDWVLYQVYENKKLLFACSMNENAEWEPDTQDADTEFVKQVGNQIESIFA